MIIFLLICFTSLIFIVIMLIRYVNIFIVLVYKIVINLG
jgi:hypothetical protein